jgi:hypothetical protein
MLDLLSDDFISTHSDNKVSLFVYGGVKCFVGWVTPNYHTAEKDRTNDIFNTLFLALRVRRYDYVLWKIKHRTYAMDSPLKKAISAVLLFNEPVLEHVSGDLEDELFNIGCFADSFATGFTQLPYGDENFHVHNVECMTIWRNFLAVTWCDWYMDRYIDRGRFGHWLEMFLNRGVLCEFELVITRSTEKECATITLGEVEARMWSKYEMDSPEYQETVQATRIFESNAVYTLADWIRVIDLPNLDRILSLLEENNTVPGHHCPNEESPQNP